ncbi:MAG: dTDP-4-dehydrorhamnose reductase [Bacteroidales bacterium]|nr:dTDP-4-dehydrorhamnose reductase [Bacteroidales bacterium]
MKNIIITGANGQLGRSLQELIHKFPEFRFHFSDIDSLDLTSYKKLENYLLKNKPDFLVNCSGYTVVDKAEEEPDKAMKLNAEVPEKLAAYANKFNFKLLHISTDYVFSGESFKPYCETDRTGPQSVYGKSKLEGEKRVMSITEAIIIRTAWLYSVYGNNFVKTILRLAKERSELNVVSDQIGTPTNAHDLALAILNIISLCTEKSNNFKPGIYHYSNEGVCSWYDFAKEIVKIAGLNCTINSIETKDYPLPAKRPFYSVLNKSKIKENFEIKIPYWHDSMEEVLTKYVNG